MPYGPLIVATSARHGLDPTLLAALIEQESSYQPDAISEAGAEGLTQVMPIIQVWCGIADPFDPYQSIECGGAWLAHLLAHYGGDVDLALAAYHAGEPAIDACLCLPTPLTAEYVASIKKKRTRLILGHIREAQVVDGCTVMPSAVQPLTAISLPYTHARISQGLHGCEYGHAALDMVGVGTEKIVSPCTCTVIQNDYDGLDNTRLVLQNDQYIVTLLHGVYSPQRGDQLISGQLIGWQASLGNSTGPHTHLNVYDRQAGGNVDPMALLPID